MSVIVFDMDDTLYLERNFVISGFRSVSKYIDERTNLTGETLFEELVTDFENGIRSRNFDLLLSRHPELEQTLKVDDLVHHYRNHEPSINLMPEAAEMLRMLKSRGYTLGIISDGYLETQTRKIRSLGLQSIMDIIVLTDIWGRDFWKPHIRAFEKIENVHGSNGDSYIYVGDNPTKDFKPAKKRGWKAIRLKIPGQLHYLEEPASAEDEPEIECTSFEELGIFLLQQDQ